MSICKLPDQQFIFSGGPKVSMQNELSKERKKQPEDRTELLASSKYTDLPQGQESLLGKRRLQSSWTSRTFHRQDSFLRSTTEKGDKEEFLWQQLPLVASETLLTCAPLSLEDLSISGKLCHKCPFFLKNKEFAKSIRLAVGELKCHQGTERESLNREVLKSLW